MTFLCEYTLINIFYCRHSLWAASVMHWFWNVYNPLTLGSIYTGAPGRLQGEQWKINGEGLTGCLVLAPLAAFFCWELHNSVIVF